MYLSNAFRKNPQTLVALLLLILGMQYVGAPTTTNAAITKRVYLTSGTTWTVPNDWVSSNNTIEAIGGGANGVGGLRFTSGAGGAAGGYAKISNLSLTGGASVSYQVAAVSDAVFNSTATTCAGTPTPSVCAKGSGGAAASSIGTVKYTGGAAGATSWGGGGSGGGAAGPGGDGAAGDASGNGGAGGNGAGGAGGAADCCNFNGEAGGAGTEYDSIPGHGSGGGAGGGLDGNAVDVLEGGAGGSGGFYGGGAGGGGSAGGDICLCMRGAGGSGAPGLIIITYESTDTGSSSQAKVRIAGGQVRIVGGHVLIR